MEFISSDENSFLLSLINQKVQTKNYHCVMLYVYVLSIDFPTIALALLYHYLLQINLNHNLVRGWLNIYVYISLCSHVHKCVYVYTKESTN